jgi:hypothetical protein
MEIFFKYSLSYVQIVNWMSNYLRRLEPVRKFQTIFASKCDQHLTCKFLIIAAFIVHSIPDKFGIKIR